MLAIAKVPVDCKNLLVEVKQRAGGDKSIVFSLHIRHDGIDATFKRFASGNGKIFQWQDMCGFEELPSLTSFCLKNYMPPPGSARLSETFFEKIFHLRAKIDIDEKKISESLAKKYLWKKTHVCLLDVFFGMHAIGFPLYVLMWISDYLPEVALTRAHSKMNLLENAEMVTRRLHKLRPRRSLRLKK